MTVMAPARRTAPTDRRTPVLVAAGTCPLGQGCYCCPDVAQHNPRGNRTCRQQHPAVQRECSLPYPANLPPCPERAFLPIDPPPPPAGVKPLRFKVCVDCGRITARRWTSPDGAVHAWCGGDFPAEVQP